MWFQTTLNDRESDHGPWRHQHLALLIILAIIVMVFGTSRLRNIGSDLGGAIGVFATA